MGNFKKTLAFIFFFLAGIVLGAFISFLAQGSVVDWLAWGKELGVENININLYIIRFSFGLMLNCTVAQLITIPVMLIVYAKTCKNL
ncbi:MAG: DUF4321 domain-containing protein [Ruminococcus sp.]|nr:DUF4321 domain-containing protein [Ruminococcus sp.]